MSKPLFNPWTPEEDAILIALREQGKTAAYIAMRLTGRTAKAIAARCGNLAQRKQKETTHVERRCLQCREMFLSKGNYRCPRCHSNTDDGAGIFATGAPMTPGGYVTRATRPA